MDGMVCSPAIIDPMASRNVRHWTTAIPIVVPMASASAKPDEAPLHRQADLFPESGR